MPTSAISGDTQYAGGAAYSSLSNTGAFVLNNSTSTNFNVSGNAVSNVVTPEPSSIVLLGTGLLGVVATLKRRFV